MFSGILCKSSLCFSYVDISLYSVQVMQYKDDINGDACKSINEILVSFWMKGQVLHHKHMHLKAPGWLSDFSVLLTRKLSVFLSCLKDVSGGSEKVWLVSGLFGRTLKLLVMLFFTVRFKLIANR